MKYQPFFMLLFVIALSEISLAQIPDYSINIDLKNKSVEVGESMLVIFHLRGAGLCKEHYILLDTEGLMNFEGEVPIFSYSINRSEPQKLELEVTRESCTKEGEVLSYAINKLNTAGTIRINLANDLFNSDFVDLETRIMLEPLNTSQSGEYDIRATFFCLNNGQ